MQYILHFSLGFTMAFIGLVPPGMLNMTAVRTKIQKDKKTALLFSIGAALVVIPQAYIALEFAKYFIKNPEILEWLSQAGIFVLFAMSLVFFMQARKKVKNNNSNSRKGNYFFIGILLSTMNMLAIPFYFFMSAFLEKKEWLIMQQPWINVFVLGASFGAFVLFLVYISFAEWIENKAQFIARNINYILSVLFLVLGILALINLIK